MIEVRYLAAARRELHDAAEYYGRNSQNLGGEFLEEVERMLSLLAETPEMGTPLGGEARAVRLRRFPVSVVYFLDEDRVIIAALSHQRRRPGYWRDRLE